MTNVKNANVKNANKNVKVETAKIEAVKLNLDMLSNEIKEKAKHIVKTEKQYLYKYPAEWTKNDIQSKQGKQFRTKCRKAIQRFSNNIFCFADMQETEKLINEINLFKIFYLENYLINDFSVDSITTSEDNKKDISLMLRTINEVDKQIEAQTKKEDKKVVIKPSKK